jgi:hypothetical protein
LKKRKPRQMTREECRDAFLDQAWRILECWESNEREPSARGKLEGLVHSLFALIDGRVGYFPGFRLAPQPHPDDRQFNKEQGQDWWPSASKATDIGGELAGTFLQRNPRRKRSTG